MATASVTFNGQIYPFPANTTLEDVRRALNQNGGFVRPAGISLMHYLSLTLPAC